MITYQNKINWHRFVPGLTAIAFLCSVLLTGCDPKSAEATNSAAADSLAHATAPRDSIVSFEALFAPNQYSEFMNTHWLEECNTQWYKVAKASSRNLPCSCSDILPTLTNDSLTIALNNTSCFPPEMETAGYKLEHTITIPLEALRPYLTEAGKQIVFESGSYLQQWLANQKKLATTVAKSPYSLYMSVVLAGKAFRMVLQSREGPNNEAGTLTGYYELEGGNKISVTGYRTWGGFVVYDRSKDASTGIDFNWSDQAETENAYATGKRYINGIQGENTVYIEALKIIGPYSLYEGPEDELREPENGIPETGG